MGSYIHQGPACSLYTTNQTESPFRENLLHFLPMAVLSLGSHAGLDKAHVRQVSGFDMYWPLQSRKGSKLALNHRARSWVREGIRRALWLEGSMEAIHPVK